MAGFGLLEKHFADQFEAQGNSYLYRRYQRDAAIAISAAERDRFIADFKRQARYMSWGTIAGLVLLLIVMMILEIAMGVQVPDAFLFVGMGVLVALAILYQRWTFDQPMKQLKGRGPSSAARSKAEMRRVLLSKQSYWEAAMGLLACPLMLLQIEWDRGLLAGWNPFWVILAAAGLGLSGWSIGRKWRFDREGH